METMLRKLNQVELGIDEVLTDEEVATAKALLKIEEEELNQRKSKANFYEANFTDCESTEVLSDDDLPEFLGGEYHMIDADTRSYIGLVDDRPVLVREFAEPVAERIGSYRFLSVQGFGYYSNQLNCYDVDLAIKLCLDYIQSLNLNFSEGVNPKALLSVISKGNILKGVTYQSDITKEWYFIPTTTGKLSISVEVISKRFLSIVHKIDHNKFKPMTKTNGRRF